MGDPLKKAREGVHLKMVDTMSGLSAGEKMGLPVAYAESFRVVDGDPAELIQSHPLHTIPLWERACSRWRYVRH